MSTDQIPAEVDPVTASEERWVEQVQIRDRVIASQEREIARLRRELRILRQRAGIVELAIIFRDAAAEHDVTGNIDTWKVIDTPEFQRATCELIESVDEFEPRPDGTIELLRKAERMAVERTRQALQRKPAVDHYVFSPHLPPLRRGGGSLKGKA